MRYLMLSLGCDGRGQVLGSVAKPAADLYSDRSFDQGLAARLKVLYEEHRCGGRVMATVAGTTPSGSVERR